MENFWYLMMGLLLIALIIVMLLPLELRARYGSEGEDDFLCLEFFLWPAVVYRYRIDMLNLKASLFKSVLEYRPSGEKREHRPSGRKKKIIIPAPGDFYRQFLFWLDIYRLARPGVIFFKKRVSIAQMEWKTRVGLGDPFHTGMAAGLAWSVKGFLVSFLYLQLKAEKNPSLAVLPDFSRAGLKMRLHLRLSTRPIYLIYAGIRVSASILFSGRAGKVTRMLKKMGARYPGGAKMG